MAAVSCVIDRPQQHDNGSARATVSDSGTRLRPAPPAWLEVGIDAAVLSARNVTATGDDDTSGRTVGRLVLVLDVVLDVVLVLALARVLWVTLGAEASQVAAATGNGAPGVIVIDGLRPSSDIPVGTFTDRDCTVTSGVAWQDRPAGVGDRKEGLRVGDRA